MDIERLSDDVEELAHTFAPGTAAAGLEEHAARHPVGAPPRAELLRVAAEHHQRAGRYADAARCAEEAVADGGPTWIDARVELLHALLALGDARAGDVLAGLERDLLALRERETVIGLAADATYAAGRYADAAAWYGRLLEDLDPDEVAEALRMRAAQRRARCRRALGLPPDGYDEVAEAHPAAGGPG